MLKATWKSLSLRASLALSMALMLVPLLISAVAGYFILHGTVIADYREVAERQRTVLVPLQTLQLAILQAEIPLEEYLLLGAAEKLRDYRALHQNLEVGFAHLMTQLPDEVELSALIARARADWAAQEAVVTELLAAREVDAEDRLTEGLSRFNSLQAGAHDKLAAAYSLVDATIEDYYADAVRGIERSEWIAGIAAAVALLLMATGFMLIGQTLRGSVERLVDGARRFSEGDRTHRIDIVVPPELNQVAEEFNRMILLIHQSEDRLVEQARRDKLTGLLNRRAYDDEIHDAHQRLQRNGERMALIMLDIDHFKRINDRHGHDAGDEVLRRVAKTILASLRSIDKVFRTGGEEFSIVLPGADGVAARATAERVRKAVEDLEIALAQGSIRVTVSQGFALGSNATDTPAALIKQADTALYMAKGAGRNTVMTLDVDAST